MLSGATDELMTLFPMPDAPASNPASPTAVNSLPLVRPAAAALCQCTHTTPAAAHGGAHQRAPTLAG